MASSFSDEAADYVDKHRIFQLFEHLMQQLVIHTPDDPLDFLIKTLEAPSPPKIILCGPPGSGKTTLARIISEKLGVVHISAGALLRNAIAKSTEHGYKVKQFVDACQLAPDDVVIQIVKTALDEPQCRERGWVLEGFPRTRKQALALQTAGILCDKFFMLELPATTCVERIMGRQYDPTTGAIYHEKFNRATDAAVQQRLVKHTDDTAEKAQAQVALYQKHSASVASSYQSVLTLIDANQPVANVIDDMLDQLKMTSKTSRIPQRPYHVILLGPPGAGKRTLGNKLKAKLDIPFVSSGELIRTAVASKTALGIKAQSFLDSGQTVPDEIIVPLIKDQLLTGDCAKRGWILDGFPRTKAQAQMLARLGVTVNCVLLLDVPDDAAIDRLIHRRIDPTNGKVYHLVTRPPPDERVKNRLVQHESDREEKVRQRLQEYHQHIADLKELYAPVLHVVRATQKPETVLQMAQVYF